MELNTHALHAIRAFTLTVRTSTPSPQRQPHPHTATLSQRMQAPPQLLGTQGAKGALPSLPEVLALCLNHLPIYDDVVEARVVHRQVGVLGRVGRVIDGVSGGAGVA